MNTSAFNSDMNTLRSLNKSDGDRAAKAQRAIELVKRMGSYRWVGLYDVLANEIPVIVQDVASDSRYLTTIGGTRGEMIQPVLNQSGVVVGTIDVESERVNAFG